MERKEMTLSQTDGPEFLNESHTGASLGPAGAFWAEQQSITSAWKAEPSVDLQTVTQSLLKGCSSGSTPVHCSHAFLSGLKMSRLVILVFTVTFIYRIFSTS